MSGFPDRSQQHSESLGNSRYSRRPRDPVYVGGIFVAGTVTLTIVDFVQLGDQQRGGTGDLNGDLAGIFGSRVAITMGL